MWNNELVENKPPIVLSYKESIYIQLTIAKKKETCEILQEIHIIFTILPYFKFFIHSLIMVQYDRNM
jgi:competence transcription factor ComK